MRLENLNGRTKKPPRKGNKHGRPASAESSATDDGTPPMDELVAQFQAARRRIAKPRTRQDKRYGPTIIKATDVTQRSDIVRTLKTAGGRKEYPEFIGDVFVPGSYSSCFWQNHYCR